MLLKTVMKNRCSPQAPRLHTESSEEPQAGSSQGSASPRDVGCRLEALTKRGIGKHDEAMFWPEHWRAKLCTCGKCRVSGASIG